MWVNKFETDFFIKLKVQFCRGISFVKLKAVSVFTNFTGIFLEKNFVKRFPCKFEAEFQG